MAGEGKRRLEKAVDGMFSNKQDKLDKIPALLGVYIDGVKTIVVAGRPDFVWCRVRGSISDIVMAFNETVGEHWDLPILIVRDPDSAHIYKVHGRDIRIYPDWGGEFYSSRPHGRSHSFGRPEGNDPVWIYKRQQMALLPRPLTSGTLGIYIEPEFYYFDGTYRWWPGSGTTSLAGFKPTGSVNGRFVTVYIDGDTGNPAYLSGPEFNAYIPPLDPIEYVSLPTPDQGLPIAAVFLITGTERIGWGEIYDLRLTVAPVPGTGSNLHVYDEGISLGMVGSMNFVGDNVEAIVSGSFAWVSVTGSAAAMPVTGSVTVYDEGVLLGQADGINVVGVEAEVVLSGTTAHIMHTGTGPNTFLELTDTPASYAGQSGTFAKVSADETALEFVNVGTYLRAGVPTALNSVTGIYWEVPDQAYATGSLSVFINGLNQRSVTDYTEQFPASGTFQLDEGLVTGSVLSVIYGALLR